MNLSTEIEQVALDVSDLGFVGLRSDGGIDLWRPALVSGGWGEENRAGREFAREAISYIGATNDGALLPGIVRTIAERGTFGGVEVGFFSALSMSLAASAG